MKPQTINLVVRIVLILGIGLAIAGGYYAYLVNLK